MSSGRLDTLDWIALALGVAITLGVNGCGDTPDSWATGGVGGEGGVGGVGGEGGEGGTGGFGGEGGVGGDEAGDPRGDRVTCDKILSSPGTENWYIQERLDIPLEPGETVTVTVCGNYLWVDGVEQPPHFDWECISWVPRFEEDGPVYDLFCVETIASNGSVTQYGVREVYVKRERPQD